jgi:hypothetical protein
MKAIDMTANAPRSRASWFQSAGAGALGVCLGFLLATTTLPSAPRGAAQPRIARTPPAPIGVAQTLAAQAAAAFAAAMPAPAGTQGETGPAPAISGGIEPCWAEVQEIVHC